MFRILRTQLNTTAGTFRRLNIEDWATSANLSTRNSNQAKNLRTKLETSNDNINSVYQTQESNQQPTSWLEQRKKEMVNPITNILTWCGIFIFAQRTMIKNKLLIAPEGMRHLND